MSLGYGRLQDFPGVSFASLPPLREIFFGKPEMGPKTFLGFPAKAQKTQSKAP
jgi:hypothetical protein